MKILVTGARYYNRNDIITAMLDILLKGINLASNTIKISTNDIFIHGGCRGVDNMVGEIAGNKGFKIQVHKAQWNKYGRGAGIIRNREMFKEQPNLILAFHPRLMDSKGTKDMVQHSLNNISSLPHNCPIILIWGNPWIGQYTELPPGSTLTKLTWNEVAID